MTNNHAKPLISGHTARCENSVRTTYISAGGGGFRTVETRRTGRFRTLISQGVEKGGLFRGRLSGPQLSAFERLTARMSSGVKRSRERLQAVLVIVPDSCGKGVSGSPASVLHYFKCLAHWKRIGACVRSAILHGRPYST